MRRLQKVKSELFLVSKMTHLLVRPLQDVDVLAVLDFQISCFRPKSPALYPKSLPANHERHGKKDVSDDFKDGNEGFKDPGRQGRRRPEEPCC